MTNGMLCTLNSAPPPENHSVDGNFQGLFSQLRKFCGPGTPTPRPPTPPAVQRTPSPNRPLTWLGPPGARESACAAWVRAAKRGRRTPGARAVPAVRAAARSRRGPAVYSAPAGPRRGFSVTSAPPPGGGGSAANSDFEPLRRGRYSQSCDPSLPFEK